MKKLGIVITVVVALVIALSCFAMVAMAVDITPQSLSSSSSSASLIGVSYPGFSAVAGAVTVVLGLSAASVVVLRRK